MLVALLIAVLTTFFGGWILGAQVFWGAVLVVALVLAALVVRDLRRLSKPELGKPAFRWWPLALADFVTFGLVVLAGAWWLEEQARGPALAEGTSWHLDCCNIESPYDQRLRQQFLGLLERDLRRELAKQGFNVREPGYARAEWWSLVCSSFATVEWTANEADEVIRIQGDVGSVCL